MKAKKKVIRKKKTTAKKLTANGRGKVKFKFIPARDEWTEEETLKKQAVVKKIVERMLNGMTPVEWQDKIRGHSY